ncbi:Outer membrane usher protein YraJ [Trichinella spiralis]|uniref:Outer membrane usher protein YraJ n=1 Tax=Trichinella spiralis TaxID=6334 RepID=A0ABR3KJC6_TRISP
MGFSISSLSVLSIVYVFLCCCINIKVKIIQKNSNFDLFAEKKQRLKRQILVNGIAYGVKFSTWQNSFHVTDITTNSSFAIENAKQRRSSSVLGEDDGSTFSSFASTLSTMAIEVSAALSAAAGSFSLSESGLLL